jgi:hypothetical protein
MAEHILAYLDNPSAYGHALARLRQLLSDGFTWERRAEELLHIACEYAPTAEAAQAVRDVASTASARQRAGWSPGLLDPAAHPAAVKVP